MEYVLHLTTSILLVAALGACGGGQPGMGKPSGTSGSGRVGTSQDGGFGDASDGAGGGEVAPASEDVEVPPAP